MLGDVRFPRRFAPLVAFGALAALVASMTLAGAALAARNGASAGAVVKTRKTSLGTILVDARGRTLYLFMKDKRNKSSCSGPCTTYWPPLTTSGRPLARTGAKTSLLATARRSDGHVQVTYNGHPLYTFLLDKQAGQTAGEGLNEFGGKWYAVSPSGAKVAPVSAAGGGGYGGGGYGGGGMGG